MFLNSAVGLFLILLLTSAPAFAGEEIDSSTQYLHQRETDTRQKKAGADETFQTMKNQADTQRDQLNNVDPNSQAALADKQFSLDGESALLGEVTAINFNEVLDLQNVDYNKIFKYALAHKIPEDSLKKLIKRAAADQDLEQLLRVSYLFAARRSYLKYKTASALLVTELLASPSRFANLHSTADFERLAHIAATTRGTYYLAINRMIDLGKMADTISSTSDKEAYLIEVKSQMQALVAALSLGTGPEHGSAARFVYEHLFGRQTQVFVNSRVTLQRVLDARPDLKSGLSAVQRSRLKIAALATDEHVANTSDIFGVLDEEQAAQTLWAW